MGVVQRVIPGKDGRVRKIELRVVRNGRVVTYGRPVTEVALLDITEGECAVIRLVYMSCVLNFCVFFVLVRMC